MCRITKLYKTLITKLCLACITLHAQHSFLHDLWIDCEIIIRIHPSVGIYRTAFFHVLQMNKNANALDIVIF